jgi:hypothetical protein
VGSGLFSKSPSLAPSPKFTARARPKPKVFWPDPVLVGLHFGQFYPKLIIWSRCRASLAEEPCSEECRGEMKPDLLVYSAEKTIQQITRLDQGCQMVNFKTQNPNLDIFRVLQWKRLVYLMA